MTLAFSASPVPINATRWTMPPSLVSKAFFTSVPDAIKAVVLAGKGRNLCAGLGLTEARERDIAESIALSRSWHRAFDRIEFGKVPVVVVLHGAVIGGGLEIAAACHVRVAESSAYYALPEGCRGIFVGGGGALHGALWNALDTRV
jgi:(methylthio)acryloyl-CoA hydratase